MILRPYVSADLEELLTLFYETVHTVNARDYTPPSWTPGPAPTPTGNAGTVPCGNTPAWWRRKTGRSSVLEI